MRQFGAVGWFAAGAAAALVGTSVFAYAWVELERATTASTVHQPLLVALDGLRARAERNGDAEVAGGIEQLARCWEAYAFAEGESPEQFGPALSIGAAVCRATRDASAGAVPSAR